MPVPDAPNDAFLFHALMETAADSIYFKDRECRLTRVNRKMAKDLGVSDPADLVGKTDIDLFGEEFGHETRLDDLRIMETDRPIVGVIESRRLANGRINWTLTTKLPLHDEAGNVVGLMGITREINELRQTEVALQHLATHDALTDLPNRFLMADRMNTLIARATRSGTTFAVLFMDIDRFKDINDSHGHEFGDLVLRGVAERLTHNVRQGDTVARIGGDEFVIVLESVHQVKDADRAAVNIERAMARPFNLQKRSVKVAFSIGISFYPEDGGDTETLLRAADRTMYQAKRAGGNRHQMTHRDPVEPG